MIDTDMTLAATMARLAEALASALNARGWMVTTAESCTGGWVAKVCTDLPGSSNWFDRGFVTYTNESKQEMLGVATETISRHGAVSEETVAEMAAGALANSHARISVAISGIAGPGGGSEEKPVGTVCFGWAVAGGATDTELCHFDGDRESVRAQAVVHALQGLIAHLT
jgi:nicotinamide-nucleotide amidase